MDGEENTTQDRSQKLYDSPEVYIRRSTLLQTIGACLGVIGAVIGFFGILDRYAEILRVEIRNEETKRINAENHFNDRLDQCCQRRH